MVESDHETCSDLGEYKSKEVIAYMIEEGFAADYDHAVKYLCPRYVTALKAALRGFDDGNYSVGKSRGDLLVVRPGTYRTMPGTRDCFWERSTKSGQTIANDFVTNAPDSVTVTTRSSDGGFSSDGCGAWLRH